jgi:probable rRNA maturation factor
MVEINNRTRTDQDEKLIVNVLEALQRHYKLANKDISVAFVGEITMRRLNRQCRQSDRVTDILSFEGEGRDLGELILCYSQIKRQGPRFGQTARQELIFILVHGFLHLVGETDETEPQRLKMIARGEDLIKKLNLK